MNNVEYKKKINKSRRLFYSALAMITAKNQNRIGINNKYNAIYPLHNERKAVSFVINANNVSIMNNKNSNKNLMKLVEHAAKLVPLRYIHLRSHHSIYQPYANALEQIMNKNQYVLKNNGIYRKNNPGTFVHFNSKPNLVYISYGRTANKQQGKGYGYLMRKMIANSGTSISQPQQKSSE